MEYLCTKQKAEGAYSCTNSGVKETSNFLFSEHGRQRNSEDKFPLASIVKYDPFSKTGKLNFYFLSRGLISGTAFRLFLGFCTLKSKRDSEVLNKSFVCILDLFRALTSLEG